ncbi:MAG: ribonuclease P protein component [Bdellovibrionales bacterium]|nr:ribonuclease P protein component [Bdellovibrionales bacterium]
MASSPSLRRFRSLSRRADFLDLKATGQSFHVNAWLLVNLKLTDRGEIRCGWTLPRQTGTAVVRNRLKRWGREFLRKWATKSKSSLDMNLIFKRRDKGFYASVSHEEFDEAMEKLVAKLKRYGG